MLVPKHRLDSWVTALSRIGWVLIILGVAGEGAYESLTSRADGLLQEFSNTLLAAAQREAADAMGEAGRANKQAAQLHKDAEGLKRGTLTLEAEVLRLRERMSDRHLT